VSHQTGNIFWCFFTKKNKSLGFEKDVKAPPGSAGVTIRTASQG